MTITVNLSEQSIYAAIRQLRQAQQNLRWGLEQTIEILTKDGAEIAQNADGSMATVIGYMDGETTGVIDAVGEAPVIAEFGAGDATMTNNPFENPPPVDVYPGSYSEQVGTGEYYLTRLEWGGHGMWHWHGMPFSAIEPRQGMWKARNYIMQESTIVAKEVIKL